MATVRDLVIQKRIANPYATTPQIASEVGVTKERVRQILVSENLPTRYRKPSYVCNNCGNKFPFNSRKSRLFCSSECRKEYYQATLRCDACGKLFTLGYSVLKTRVKSASQHFYCSLACKGAVIGRDYGFRAHPENRKTLSKVTKTNQMG